MRGSSWRKLSLRLVKSKSFASHVAGEKKASPQAKLDLVETTKRFPDSKYYLNTVKTHMYLNSVHQLH